MPGIETLIARARLLEPESTLLVRRRVAERHE
jgi:hypothetical protein